MKSTAIYALVILIAVSLFTTQAEAQSDSALFYADQFESDFFFQMESSFGQMLGNSALFTGLSGNWLIKHKHYLGFKFKKLASQEDLSTLVQAEEDELVQLKHQRAGISYGMIIKEKSRVSLSPELAVLWANALYEYPETKIYRWNFAHIEPSIHIQIKAGNHLRVGANMGYSAAVGLDLNGLKSSDLSGVFGGLFLRMGTF